MCTREWNGIAILFLDPCKIFSNIAVVFSLSKLLKDL